MTPIEKVNARDEALRLLGLSAMPTRNALRKTRRRLIFEKHPDHCPDSAADLARINAAYGLLLECCLPDPVTPGNGGIMPGRPVGGTRLVALREDMEAQCRTLLREGRKEGADDAAAETQEAVGMDHVPHLIRRRGRRLSYLIRTPLEKGENRVALPAGDLADERKQQPRLLCFMSRQSGRATYELPEETRAGLFPGAHSVRIHFAVS